MSVCPAHNGCHLVLSFLVLLSFLKYTHTHIHTSTHTHLDQGINISPTIDKKLSNVNSVVLCTQMQRTKTTLIDKKRREKEEDNNKTRGGSSKNDKN